MRETKKDQILRLHALKLPRASIARMAKCSVNYTYVTIWRAAHPGYASKWMAQKRATDPDYRAREKKLDSERYYRRCNESTAHA